jgi:bifunctional DNase/RNase
MVKVTAIHAVKNEGNENYILMLLDQPGRRVLPIWVGAHEGEHILLQLRRFPTSRPVTFRFVTDLLATTDVKLQEVRIDALKDDVFYATAIIHNKHGWHEIDARPSDAIALALYTDTPLYIAAEVMTRVGRDLPQAFDEEVWQKTTLSDAEMEKVYSVTPPRLFNIEEELTRFTARAEVVWQQAYQEAKRFHHQYVGTEHLLLAMARDQESLAAAVLREMGASLEQVENAAEGFVGPNLLPYSGELIVVPRLTEVVHLAEEERRVLGHKFIGTEHLLFGLVKEGKGAAANILRQLGVNMNQVRNQIIDHISRNTTHQ